MNNPSLRRVFGNELSKKEDWVDYCKKTILAIVEITGLYTGDGVGKEVEYFEAFHQDTYRFRIKFAVPKDIVPSEEEFIHGEEERHGGNLFVFDSETIKNTIIPAMYKGIWEDSKYYGETIDNPILRDISRYRVDVL
jgi:hypothetical protein